MAWSFVWHMPNIIKLDSNYIIIDQRKLLIVFRRIFGKFKQTNQIGSPLKIKQPINVGKSTCYRNNKGTCNFFYKARNPLVVQCREKRKKTKDGANLFFKTLANRFCLTSKNSS